MDCGGKCLKFLMVFFNLIVFFGGGVMAGYGIYLLVEAKEASGTVSIVLPAFITTFGLLVFFIAFLGCCGAWKNNSCMLKTFGVIVIILLICEAVCAILLLVYRHQFVGIVEENFQSLIKELEDKKITEDDPSIKTIYKLQKSLECCGGSGPGDWKNPPDSCCEGSGSGGSCTTYKTGCAKAMYQKVKDSALTFGIIILILALIQIGAIICAFCLAKEVKNYERI